MAADYARYRHHFYAFDTFEGMPKNDEGSVIFTAGNFLCLLEEFARLNRAAGAAEMTKLDRHQRGHGRQRCHGY